MSDRREKPTFRNEPDSRFMPMPTRFYEDRLAEIDLTEQELADKNKIIYFIQNEITGTLKRFSSVPKDNSDVSKLMDVSIKTLSELKKKAEESSFHDGTSFSEKWSFISELKKDYEGCMDLLIQAIKELQQNSPQAQQKKQDAIRGLNKIREKMKILPLELFGGYRKKSHRKKYRKRRSIRKK